MVGNAIIPDKKKYQDDESRRKSFSNQRKGIYFINNIFEAWEKAKIVARYKRCSVNDFRRGCRPWRTWLEPRSDFLHLRIFCINLFEANRLNILSYTLYSYKNKNLGSPMSYFF